MPKPLLLFSDKQYSVLKNSELRDEYPDVFKLINDAFDEGIEHGKAITLHNMKQILIQEEVTS